MPKGKERKSSIKAMSSWANRRRKGEHGVPVELRFVDMFMAAIGALIFMAMLMSVVMSQLGKKDSAAEAAAARPQLRVLARVEPASTNSSLDDFILGQVNITALMAGTNGTDFKKVLGTNSLDADVMITRNYLESNDHETPFILLTFDRPKASHYSFRFQYHIETYKHGALEAINHSTNQIHVCATAKYGLNDKLGGMSQSCCSPNELPGAWTNKSEEYFSVNVDLDTKSGTCSLSPVLP